MSSLSYLNTLGNTFVADDLELIPTSAHMHDPLAVGDIVLGRYWGELRDSAHYRPLTVWSIAVDYRLNELLGSAGASVTLFHVTNLVLHAVAGVLACLFLASLGMSAPSAAVASLLFAVLPIHTDAIAPITGRAEPLALILGLAFLILHRRRRLLGPGAACLFLALWSKESAITFALLAPWMDLCLRSPGRVPWARYLVYGGVVSGWLWLRSIALRGGHTEVTFLDNPLATASVGERILTALRVQLDYLRLQIFPTGLSSDYSFEQIPIVSSLLDPHVLVFLGVLSLAAWASWRWRRSHPLIAFAVGGYAILASVTSNLLFPIVTIMAERLAYAPSLLMCALIGYGAGRLGPWRRPAVLVPLIAVVLTYAGTTLARNRTWASEDAYFQAQLRSAPRSAKVQYNAGLRVANHGDPRGAMRHYRSAAEIYPGFWSAWNGMGMLYAGAGDLEAATASFRRAIATRPHYAKAYNNLGTVYARQGRVKDAEAAFRSAIRYDPGLLGAYENLGRLALEGGRPEEAIQIWEQALRIDPGYEPIRRRLAAARARASG